MSVPVLADPPPLVLGVVSLDLVLLLSLDLVIPLILFQHFLIGPEHM